MPRDAAHGTQHTQNTNLVQDAGHWARDTRYGTRETLNQQLCSGGNGYYKSLLLAPPNAFLRSKRELPVQGCLEDGRGGGGGGGLATGFRMCCLI